MTQPCPNCGTLNSPNHRFCSNCGAALSSNSSPATGTAPTGDTSPSTAYVVKKTDLPEPGPYASDTRPVPAPPPASRYDSSLARTEPYSPQPPVAPPAPGYQSYSPGTPVSTNGPARTDGAAYIPYSASTAGTLEKPKDQRSWLVPVIIGAAVVLLGLVLLSAYLVVQGRSSPTASNNPAAPSGGAPRDVGGLAGPSPTALPANASEEDKIREVIYRSNENQIKSWTNLDTEILKKNYTGAALDDNIKQVQDLQQRGMYAVPRNEQLQILDVKPNGNAATAHTHEVWTVTYYNKGDSKQINSQSYSLSETYHFVKQNGTWYIDKLDINDTSSTPTPGT